MTGCTLLPIEGLASFELKLCKANASDENESEASMPTTVDRLDLRIIDFIIVPLLNSALVFTVFSYKSFAFKDC